MSAGRVLVTGSAGFIGGYVVEELLRRDYAVVGVDDHSKYGPVRKSYDDDPRYTLVEGDARDVALLGALLTDCDHMIAGAAMIGGISYFHTFAYDLLATNERIMAASCDAAIVAHREARLQKVTYLSSSMVYESTASWPSYEGQELEIPPPHSSYGFQKLAVEYYARAAHEQHGLPYTIVRPFNCVGTGEMRALSDVEVASGNVKLAMSHVVPDLVQKIVKGQEPLHLLGDGTQVRHYTYAGDLARGIVTAMEHPAARNDDFNLSTAQSTTVLELAENIWRRLRGDAPFRTIADPPFEHDVQRRVPSVEKARAVLGFEADTSLDEMLDEVVPWVVDAVGRGLIQPMSDNRKFWRVLLLIVLGALAFRVGYVLLAKRNEPVLGDQIYYNAQANTIARGHGFTDFRDGTQTAEHPPLTALALTPTSWVMEQFDPGGNHLLAQRLTMTGFGAIVVLLIGLIGRAVAGDRAGLVAAGIAALYPNLWINDGLVMSETLATLAVALAILLAYRFIRRPRASTAAWVGVACGLAMLARAELGLLLPLMVLPVALFMKQFPVMRRLGVFLVACIAALVVVSPWLIANLTRFDDPVLFSTNDGLTLCGANLHRTYYGQGTGLWALDCASFPVPKGDRSVVSNVLRSDGLHFIRDHLGRLPVVVAVREARVWSLYAPGMMASYNVNEGRDVEVSWAGFFAFWILVPCAVVGAVQLRRRRMQLTPLLSQFVIVAVTAGAIYGITRFRTPAEVSLVVLAAVAVDHWWGRRSEPAARPVADAVPA